MQDCAGVVRLPSRPAVAGPLAGAERRIALSETSSRMKSVCSRISDRRCPWGLSRMRTMGLRSAATGKYGGDAQAASQLMPAFSRVCRAVTKKKRIEQGKRKSRVFMLRHRRKAFHNASKNNQQ